MSPTAEGLRRAKTKVEKKPICLYKNFLQKLTLKYKKLVMVNSKLLKHHSKAKHMAPAYSQVPYQIKWVVQRLVQRKMYVIRDSARKVLGILGFGEFALILDVSLCTFRLL